MSDSPSPCPSRFFSPFGLLMLMSLSQLMMYFDRGLIAGSIPLIQTEINQNNINNYSHHHHTNYIQTGDSSPPLNDAEAGILGSGFTFGYMLACPLFAFFSRSYSPLKLMAIGLFIWINAVSLCGLTNNYITLLGGRILTGIGEASFAGLAPSCIDQVSPPKHRTLWLSVFFSFMSIGAALGFLFAAAFNTSTQFSWHIGFIVEAILMIPLTILVYLWPHLDSYKNINHNENSTISSSSSSISSSPRRSSLKLPQQQRAKSHVNLYSLSAEPEEENQHNNNNNNNNNNGILPHPSVSFASTTNHPNHVDSNDLSIKVEFEGGEEAKENSSLLPSPSSSPSLRLSSANKSLSSSKSHPDLNRIQSDKTLLSPSSTRLSSSSPHSHSRSHSPTSHSSISPSASNSSLRRSLSHSAPRRLSRLSSRYGSTTSLSSSYSTSLEQSDFLADCRLVVLDGVWILLVLGYSSIAFVSGALSFWAPADFSKTLHLTLQQSTQAVGIITFLCGLFGTGFGGWMLDKRAEKMKNKGKGLTQVRNAMELCVLFTSISILFASISVYLTDVGLSLSCLAVGLFFMFGVGAPVNAAILSITTDRLKSLSMAMSILFMHLLGDLPSPFLLGYVTDNITDVRFALVSLICWLSFAILFWSIAAHLAKKRVKENSEFSAMLDESTGLLQSFPSYNSLHNKIEGIIQ